MLLRQKASGSAVYARARQKASRGYPVQVELEKKYRQIRKETVAVYMLVGV